MRFHLRQSRLEIHIFRLDKRRPFHDLPSQINSEEESNGKVRGEETRERPVAFDENAVAVGQ